MNDRFLLLLMISLLNCYWMFLSCEGIEEVQGERGKWELMSFSSCCNCRNNMFENQCCYQERSLVVAVIQ